MESDVLSKVFKIISSYSPGDHVNALSRIDCHLVENALKNHRREDETNRVSIKIFLNPVCPLWYKDM